MVMVQRTGAVKAGLATLEPRPVATRQASLPMTSLPMSWQPERLQRSPAVSTRVAMPAVHLRAPEPSTKGAAYLKVPHRWQGASWGCGTNSLYMAMRYHLGVLTPPFETIDSAVRPTGKLFGNVFGTSPTALADYAKTRGLTANVVNRADTRLLREQLDQGLPVIVLGDRSSRWNGGLHYRVLVGYEGNDDATTTWRFQDSLIEDGTELVQTTDELMYFWTDLRIFGARVPYERLAITLAPSSQAHKLPPDNRSTINLLFDSAMNGVSDKLKTVERRLGQ